MYYKIISMDSHETWAPAVLFILMGGFFRLVKAFLLLFSPYGVPFSLCGGCFATFFTLWEAIWGPYCYFFFHIGGLFFPCGGPFLGLPSPPPTTAKISASTHWQCHDINLKVKFVENTLPKKFISEIGL